MQAAILSKVQHILLSLYADLRSTWRLFNIWSPLLTWLKKSLYFLWTKSLGSIVSQTTPSNMSTLNAQSWNRLQYKVHLSFRLGSSVDLPRMFTKQARYKQGYSWVRSIQKERKRVPLLRFIFNPWTLIQNQAYEWSTVKNPNAQQQTSVNLASLTKLLWSFSVYCKVLLPSLWAALSGG